MNESLKGLRRRLVLLGGLAFTLMLPLTALAGVCEETFLSAIEEGAMRFMAVEPQPGVDPATGAENLKRTLAADGLIVVDTIEEGGAIRLHAAQRATQATPDLLLIANVSNASAELFTMVPVAVKGSSTLRADSAYMREHLCRWLASATRGGGDTMDARTAPPSDRSSAKMRRPSLDFDASQARIALEPGSSVITGTACANYGGNWVYPSSVILLPMTPYLAEYLRLVKKARAADEVHANPEVFSIRLVGRTNAKGQFRFADLKAGSYYLYTETGARVEYERDVAVGTASTPIGNYAIMGKENYTNDHHNQIEKVVTIAGEGKTVDVELTPRNGLFTNNGGAGLFGCR